MKRQQTFEAGTREEAEGLAAAFMKRHPGCRVIDRKAIHSSTMNPGTPISSGGDWTLVLEYDDEPKPA